MTIETKKSSPGYVKDMAFVCRACERQGSTKTFFEGVLLLTGVEDGTTEAYATDGRRLHKVIFKNHEIESMGLTEFIFDREDKENWQPVGFAHQSPNKWVFSKLIEDVRFPNVLRVIPEFDGKEFLVFFVDEPFGNDKNAIIGSYYQGMFHALMDYNVSKGVNARPFMRLNSQFLTDLVINKEIPTPYVFVDTQNSNDSGIGTTHTAIIFTDTPDYDGHKRMALIMPMLK